MLRSLYSAVSSVKAHQTYLDVTGNNIANVNTTGFKKDVLQFRDMIYQNVKNASSPNSSIPIGGVNPAQVGLGVSVGSIETVHSGGSLQSTGLSTDMAISGNGYFVVQNGTQRLYTRAGNFSLDKEGNLVMQGNGYQVQGYAYHDQIDPATGNTVRVKDSSLSTINIPIGEKTPAKATQLAEFRCNLCSTTTAEITSTNNIPGGTDQVLRPHSYTAYGSSTKVTGIGETADRPAAPSSGDLYYDTDLNELMKYDGTNWVSQELDATTLYYGPDASGTTTFDNIYMSGDGTLTGIVGTKTTIDSSGAGDPTTLGVTPTKAGQTYLDTANGQIYTANSTGTAWLSSPASVEEGVAYAVKGSSDVYAVDSTGALVLAPSSDVMDTANSDNVFRWDGSSWTNVNLLESSGLKASENSTTTQATIDAFGESMIASRDWEDKFTVYDSLGNPYTMIVCFRKVMETPADPNANPPTGAETEWDWYAYYVDSDGSVLEQYGEGAGTMVFGDDGLLTRTYYYEATPATPDPNGTETSQPEYEWAVVEKIIGDPAYDNVATGKVVADFNTSGAAGSVVDGEYVSNMITLDFLGDAPINGVTQYGSSFTTKLASQDGYEMGVLEDWYVGGDGIIMGTYSNGQTLELAQVALATFANAQGLSKVGETCFAETVNSGIAQIGEPMVGGAGSIVGNTVEMSNVDLSEEFVNLIRAQRGFQAASRVVTTSDQVLEELINLKR